MIGLALLAGGFLGGVAVTRSLWQPLKPATIPVQERMVTTTVLAPDADVFCHEATTMTALTTTTAPLIVATSTIPTPTETRLLFVGDMMLDRNVSARSRAAHDLAYPFAKLPPGWLGSFDYTIGNLEGPVTLVRRPPEKSIDFQFDPAVLPILRDQGFDAFSQANNHALDQGAQGYVDSVQMLRKQGFLVFGHQVQDGDIAMATTTIEGKRFVFVGWNTTDNPIDLEVAARVLRKARSQADWVIAFMHWGAEYQDRPLPSVQELSHWLIDHGVDVVIGGHPHWVQGLSRYQGRPIVYSLGNFIFDQDFSDKTMRGLAMELVFRNDQVDLKPLPLRIDKSQPRLLRGGERDAELVALGRISDASLAPQVTSGTISFPLPFPPLP